MTEENSNSQKEIKMLTGRGMDCRKHGEHRQKNTTYTTEPMHAPMTYLRMKCNISAHIQR